ncbi:MAG: RES domain-containing protein [Phycisphaerae bacterium]
MDLPIGDDENIPIIVLGLINVKLPALKVEKDCPWKPQYFISRFISDCAKEQGFKGIVFNSRKHYERNLVLFDWKKEDIIFQDEPRIVQIKRSEYPENGGTEF